MKMNPGVLQDLNSSYLMKAHMKSYVIPVKYFCRRLVVVLLRWFLEYYLKC